MARAFLGSNGSSPSVAFLWSVGEGDEARGYGKTRHLLWFADRVNADFGRSGPNLAGRQPHQDSSVAAYAAFSSVDGLSLSNLLFDVVRDLVGARRETLIRARDAAFNKGRTPDHLYASAQQALQQTGERWSARLLYFLCYHEPAVWIEYLDNRYRFSQWHKVRYGRELLRSSVAFLRQLSAADHTRRSTGGFREFLDPPVQVAAGSPTTGGLVLCRHHPSSSRDVRPHDAPAGSADSILVLARPGSWPNRSRWLCRQRSSARCDDQREV
jgi:hypothetical protein